jgi:hypothetical protein
MLTIVTSLLILTTFVQAGLADEAADPEGSQDTAAAPAVLSSVVGGQTMQTRAVGETAATTRTSTTWANVPGASIPISIPQPGFLLARFAAETACFAPNDGSCAVRLMVNGVQMNPASGIDFALDSTNNGGDLNTSREGHAMERFTHCLPAGNYLVTAQWASRTNGAVVPTFRLDDWTLVVEHIDNCQPGGG